MLTTIFFTAAVFVFGFGLGMYYAGYVIGTHVGVALKHREQHERVVRELRRRAD